VPYPAESAALSGVQKHCDYMLYRRTVDVPRNFTNGGQHLRLNFGADNYDATVYMNATELARHTGATTHSASTSPVPSDPSAARDRGGGALFGGQRHHPGWQVAIQPWRHLLHASSGTWPSVWLEPVAATSIASFTATLLPDGIYVRPLTRP